MHVTCKNNNYLYINVYMDVMYYMYKRQILSRTRKRNAVIFDCVVLRGCGSLVVDVVDELTMNKISLI